MTHSLRQKIAVGSSALLLAGSLLAACAQEESDGGGAEHGDIELGQTGQKLAMRSSTLWQPKGATDRKIQIKACFITGEDEIVGDDTFSQTQKDNIRAWVRAGWENIDNAAGNTIYGVQITWQDVCPPNPDAEEFISIAFDKDLPPPGRVPNGKLGSEGIDQTPSMVLRSVNQHTVLHEFGHMLSFTHEWDREEFPTFCSSNNSTEADMAVTALDTLSIMNYTDCGGGTTLSAHDIAGFRRVYGKVAVRLHGSAKYLTSLNAVNLATGLTAESEILLENASSAGSSAALRFGDEFRFVLNMEVGYVAKPFFGSGLTANTSRTSASLFKLTGGTVGAVVNVNDPVKIVHVSSGQAVRYNGTDLVLDSVASASTFRFIAIDSGREQN